MVVDIQQELTDAEREEVADRLLVELRERFDGVRKAAYTAAGVNPATWTGPAWAADADDPWVPAQVALKEFVDDELADVDRRFDELADRVRELERMVLGLVEPEGDAPSERHLKAARHAKSAGKQRRAELEGVGEESQDDGGVDPA